MTEYSVNYLEEKMPFDLKWITWTTGVLHRRNVGLFYFKLKLFYFASKY